MAVAKLIISIYPFDNAGSKTIILIESMFENNLPKIIMAEDIFILKECCVIFPYPICELIGQLKVIALC